KLRHHGGRTYTISRYARDAMRQRAVLQNAEHKAAFIAAGRQHNAASRKTYTCMICGITFTRADRKGAKRKTCSYTCACEAKRRNMIATQARLREQRSQECHL